MFEDGMLIKSELNEASVYPIELGEKILSHPGYVDYVETLSKVINITHQEVYQALYVGLLEHYAQFVQSLEKPRDKLKGKLLHYGLRRSYGFIRQTAPLVWKNKGFGFDPDRLIYALYSAALLNGIGRTFQDRVVEVCDEHGQYIRTWFPNTEILNSGFYKVRAIKSQQADFVDAVHSVYAQVVMPASGLAWIMEDQRLFLLWKKALVDMQDGFGELEIDCNIDQMARDAEGEFEFAKGHPGMLPPETMEGEKFLAWLKEKIQKDASIINKDGSGLSHIEQGLLVEVDHLVEAFVKETGEGRASATLVKSQFEKLGFGATSAYLKSGGSFLGAKQDKEIQAVLIEYEKGLFESGVLGPVMSVASQSQITSGERFFTRIGGVAQQFQRQYGSSK